VVGLPNTKEKTGKQLPHYDDESKANRFKFGRRSHEDRTAAFLEVVRYLEESDEEQTAIGELVIMMGKCLQGTDLEPYSAVYMKTKMQDHFGERIIITELNGKHNVVTLWNTARSILHDFHQQTKGDTIEGEKLRIIQAAAKLTRSDVKSMDVSNDTYPTVEDMSSTDTAIRSFPETLQIVIKNTNHWTGSRHEDGINWTGRHASY
jgi:hypothetical protein